MEAFRDLLLKGHHQQLRQQQGRAVFPDHLHDVRFLPLVLLPNGFEAGLAEFHADRVRSLLRDHAIDQVGAFPGNMGGADEDDLPAVDGQAMYISMIQQDVPSKPDRKGPEMPDFSTRYYQHWKGM